MSETSKVHCKTFTAGKHHKELIVVSLLRIYIRYNRIKNIEIFGFGLKQKIQFFFQKYSNLEVCDR